MPFITNFKNGIESFRSAEILLIAIVAGLFLGLSFPDFSKNLQFIANTYIDILKVLTMPLILCAILLNIQTLLGDKVYLKTGWRALWVLLSVSILAAVMGIVLAYVFQPGLELSLDNLKRIELIVGDEFVDQVMRINYISTNQVIDTSLVDLIVGAIVPSNIFYSLAQGEIIKVALFSIMLGLALSSVPTRLVDGFNQSLESVLAACHKLSALLSHLIPLVAFIIAATISSKISSDAMVVLSRFIVSFLISTLLVISLSVWVLRNRSQLPLIEVLIALKPTLAISVTSAQYTTACIPQMVETLHQRLGFSRERVELMVPLAATFVRSVPILFFAMAAVFVSQIYSHDLSLMDLLTILIVSMGLGLASLGLRGQQKLAMLAVVCSPLGLPNESVLMLLLAVEPFCEILGSTSMVVSQCASVAMICNRPIRL